MTDQTTPASKELDLSPDEWMREAERLAKAYADAVAIHSLEESSGINVLREIAGIGDKYAAWKDFVAHLRLRCESAAPIEPTPSTDALTALARRCLWIAYCWNDHNFEDAYTYARKTAQEHGITSFNEASEWLASPAPAPEAATPPTCSLGCTTSCKADEHGCPSECPSQETRRGFVVASQEPISDKRPQSRVPLTEEQIKDWIMTIATYRITGWQLEGSAQITRFARAVEAHHGIIAGKDGA